MAIKVDPEKFQLAHENFLAQMKKDAGGQEFLDFRHPAIMEQEIEYKNKVFRLAKETLELDKWDKLLKTNPTEIIGLVKKIFGSYVSDNLVEHRYGSGNPDKPLYKKVNKELKLELAHQLYNFFKESNSEYSNFGPRFDEFASFLRTNKLGCVWQFMSYLSFVLDSTRYFPVHSGNFQKLLRFYGNDVNFSGTVTWERYRFILDLADLLEEKLVQYKYLDRIAVHSYMWVISELIRKEQIKPIKKNSIDFSKEFEKRKRKAENRELLGLKGEEYIYKSEIEKLENLGKPNLAKKVKLVSFKDDSEGYDIKSYDKNGNVILIEVKTTTRAKQNDGGFWLTSNEYEVGKKNPNWKVYRVWEIDKTPTYDILGNLVQENNGKWEFANSSYFVRNKNPDV